MSLSNHSRMTVGCPQCDATVTTSLPASTDAAALDWDDPNRLQGKRTDCRNCGHELEVYFY